MTQTRPSTGGFPGYEFRPLAEPCETSEAISRPEKISSLVIAAICCALEEGMCRVERLYLFP